MCPENLEAGHEQEKEASKKHGKEEVLKETGENLENLSMKMLVEQAAAKSDKELELDSYTDLYEENPALAILIKKVAGHFGIPEPLLYATFEHESHFKHGLVGYPGLKGKSGGIGQFREMTWDEINGENAKEFVEFRAFMDQCYPGRKFARGENILADIAATAAFLKYLGGKRTKFSKLPEYRLVFMRARYVGDKDFKEQMKYYVSGEYDGVDQKYKDFIRTYKKYKTTWREAPGALLAE